MFTIKGGYEDEGDFKEFDGGYVTFRGRAKGGRITESNGAGHSSEETGSSQDYILMPLRKDGSLFDFSLKNSSNDEPQPSNDTGKKDDEVPTAPLESTYADFFGDESELDLSNIATKYPVPSTPNTRIHKDHLLDHVIGDVQSGVQTRRMINEQGFIRRAQEGNPSIKRSKLDRSYARRDFAIQITTSLDNASRPDIMFAICACARFQVTPKVSHLHVVKRIFRYLKDRKSLNGGCQFLARRLISWQCKKQTIVANSTTEAQYVATASCCGQVL
ncbi:hypothetical protein Tco_0353153 [Tanacetum coccineum]